MKRWLAVLMVLAMGRAPGAAADSWPASELKEAAKQIGQRDFAFAHDLYRNVLLVHQAAPLGANDLQAARRGIAASGGRLKAAEATAFGKAFLDRAKQLGFVQVGAAWVPSAVKDRLSADGAGCLERKSRAKACPACRGPGVNICPNCENGSARCMSCSGTGRTGGAAITTRGAECLPCNGRGKLKCPFCSGASFSVCPKCEGLGVVD